MTAVLALAACMWLGVVQTPQSATVQGRVQSAADGAPLAGAVVTLVAAGRLVVSDEQGRYVLHDVPPGERRIRASRLGYAPLQVVLTVPDGGRLSVDFLLTLRPVDMPPVTASAGFADTTSLASRSEDVTPGTAVIRLLEASPGVSETGITATAQALLGSDPPIPDNILYVRGAGTALDLMLLDGAPVHAPFHLGGLLEPGLPQAVVRATRLQGGAPARYDGGLADVLRLETRSASSGEPHGRAFLDMVSVGGSAEGEIDPVRVLVTARSLHGQGAGPFVQGTFPQRYADALVRLDVGLRHADSLHATGFWNRESVVLSPAAAHEDSPEWGNAAGSLRYRRLVPGGTVEMGAAFGEFRTRLPIGRDPVIADGRTRRLRFTVDGLLDARRLSVGYGVHLDKLALENAFSGRRRGGDTIDVRQDNAAVDLAGYLDGEWIVSPALRVGAGFRADVFSGKLGQSVQPRARVEWTPGSSLQVRVSAGRFHQLVAAADTTLPAEAALVTATDGEPLGHVSTRISVAEASHFVLGVGHVARDGSRLTVEGYWKTSRGLPVLRQATLENAGVDIWLRQDLGRLRVWGSYSMAWAWASNRGGQRTEIFAGRHFLRTGVEAEIGGRIRLEMDAAYGGGLEFGIIPRPVAPSLGAVAEPAAFQTVYPFGPDDLEPPPILLTVPEGTYVRLNLRASARVNARLFGRRSSFHPYIRVINALDRPDALFYQLDRQVGAQPRAIGAVPLLPVVGFEWRM